MYDVETEKVSKVSINPNNEWGGQGLLGCDVVQGIVHNIPARKKQLWRHLENDQEDENDQFHYEGQRVKGADDLEELAANDNEQPKLCLNNTHIISD